MPSSNPLPGRDRRYTITCQYCGTPAPRNVARFCDDWLGQSRTHAGALAIVRAHIALRDAHAALAQAEAAFALASWARGTG
jgi:nitrate reductase alpha subunit